MDEYKYFFYKLHPNIYGGVNAGNVTGALSIRESLKCKPFDWFIREIAFDSLRDYPPRNVFTHAWGTVQSQSDLILCIDARKIHTTLPIEATHCGRNLTRPSEANLFFDFTWRSEIRVAKTSFCWETSDSKENSPVTLGRCHLQGGNQSWHLNLVSVE